MSVEVSLDVARWKRRARLSALVLIAVAVMTPAARAAEHPPPRSRVDGDGAAHLPALTVPASEYLSAESRSRLIALFANPKPRPADSDIRKLREYDEQKNAPFVARDEVLYPVNIEPRTIGGVRTQVITPKDGVAPENRTRVLVNLHAGGFVWGEGNGARTESIPIAGVGRITVITVAYREAPESRFPAASEDVTAVYRELLKDHAAADIGIYGCSAGGILTAEAIAWFQKEQLPSPGAIGTFCGSAVAPGGDSNHFASLLVGEIPFSGSATSNPYFHGASPSDPLVFPGNSAQVLAKFPPTLLIAGSRDPTVSSLFRSQALLSKAGVDAELHVWDGMWHAFFMDPDLPESQEVYRVVVDFFARHLGTPAAAAPAR
jgi:acetyl esterase/lipase